MYSDYLDNLADNRARSNADVRSWLYWVGGAAFVLVSVSVFLINTNHGIGVLSDSTRYMSLTERPYDAPLYPWLLQLASWLGVDLDRSTKAIGLILVSANTAIIWHLLVRATGKYAYAAVGTAVVVLYPVFVALHASAMSEPLFLFTLLVTLMALLRYLDTEARVWLVACAVVLALATLTRFTAPPLGAAIALVFLFNPRFSLGRRIGDAFILGAVSAALFLSWVVISQITAGHSIGRALWFYGNMGLKEWLTSLEALAAWLFPDQVPFSARVVVFGLFALAAAGLTILHACLTLRHARETKVVDALLPAILGLFFIFYMGFMVLSTSIEANLALNGRYAFPAYVMTVLMITIVLADFDGAKGFVKVLHHGLVGLAVLVLVSHAVRTTVRSQEAYRSGIGYASVAWATSPTIETLRQLPASAALYSNGADVIAYVLKRPAHFIPQHVELRTGLEDPAKPFEAGMQRLRENLAKPDSYVVMFDNVDWRFYQVTEAELKQRLSLVAVTTKPDGRVYALPKTP